jgi:hypothetical protein
MFMFKVQRSFSRGIFTRVIYFRRWRLFTVSWDDFVEGVWQTSPRPVFYLVSIFCFLKGLTAWRKSASV